VDDGAQTERPCAVFPNGSLYAVQIVAMAITILNWLKFVNASVDPLLAEQVKGSGLNQ
jgi:hypothetical protein